MRAKLALALAVVVGVFAHGAVARADGDPASDVLLGQNVYYPYPPNLVSKPVRGALDAMVARAKAVGYPVKVAIIAARADLGAYPYLFDQPQRYADLLTKEISFNTTAPVLAVLPDRHRRHDTRGRCVGRPAGYPAGVAEWRRRIGPHRDGRHRPAHQSGGHAGGRSARRLRRAARVEIGAGKGGGIPSLLIFGIPVALVAAAAGVLTFRERRRKDVGDRDRDLSADGG